MRWDRSDSSNHSSGSDGSATRGLRTGLRHRLRRASSQIEEQHRALRVIASELDGALLARSPAQIRDWLDRFSDSLRAHFDLEESVLFPAVHGLAEAAEPDLDRLTEEHGVFLETLAQVLESVAAGASGDPTSTVTALRERLRDHEQREEALLVQVLGVSEEG